MGLKISRSADPAPPPSTPQRLSLCMIMKNEEEHLARCLESVKGIADEIIIVDTGSTDRSIEIAESFGATIIHEAWINDFAHHRNTGLEVATGDWILMLDADEELVNGTDLLPLLHDPDMDGYSLREVNYTGAEVGADSVVHAAFRLFRNKPHHRYAGALHEQIYFAVDPAATRSRFVDVEILHYGYLDGTTETKRKKERNMRIALAEVKRKPKDSFILFNAGVEFQRAGDSATAADYFSRAFMNLPTMRLNFASLLLRNLSATLGDLERYDDAITVLTDAIEAYPEYTDLYFVMAQTYWKRREYRKAIDAFRQAIEVGEHRGDLYMSQRGMGTFASWHGLGVMYETLGDIRQAVACLRTSITSAKGAFYAPPFARLTKIAVNRETPEETVAFMRTLLPTKHRADALRMIGDVLVGEGHGAHALPLYDEALELSPTSHMTRVSRAHCLVTLERVEDAHATVAEIPETSDVYALGLAKLALAGMAAGDLETMDDAIKRLAPVAEASWVEMWRVARAARAGGDVTLSDAEATEVVNTLVALAGSLLRMEKLDAFNALVLVLRRVAPDRSQVDEALGLLFDDAGFGDQATQCLVEAAQAGRELTPDALLVLARECAERDLPEDAEGFFQAAIDADPENQSYYIGYVTFLSGMRRYADAVEVLKAGTKIWPHSTMFTELGESMNLMAAATPAA